MKKNLFILSLMMVYHVTFSQQWGGSTTQSNDIYRLGNVGIGSLSTVDTKLEIRDDNPLIRLRDNQGGSGGTSYLHFGQTDGGVWNPTGYIGDATGMGRYMMIGTGTGVDFGIGLNGAHPITTPNFYIKASNGNVGIGTNVPEAKLHLNGSSYESIMKIVNNQTGSPKIASFLAPQIGYNNRVMMILGTEEIEGRSSIIEFINSSDYETSYTQIRGYGSSSYDGLLVLHNGSVGIKTKNTDGYALRVNGSILSEELAVNGSITANGKITAEEIEVVFDVPNFDHVFYDNYELPSLKEVESYIKEQKHLMDIPSAKEFKENGYKVGEMDGLLLKKIEELTLYIIEQEKTIEAQREQLAKQEKSIGEILDKLQQN